MMVSKLLELKEFEAEMGAQIHEDPHDDVTNEIYSVVDWAKRLCKSRTGMIAERAGCGTHSVTMVLHRRKPTRANLEAIYRASVDLIHSLASEQERKLGFAPPKPDPRFRLCYRCQKFHLTGSFAKSAKTSDGLGTYCPECQKVVQQQRAKPQSGERVIRRLPDIELGPNTGDVDLTMDVHHEYTFQDAESVRGVLDRIGPGGEGFVCAITDLAGIIERKDKRIAELQQLLADEIAAWKEKDRP